MRHAVPAAAWLVAFCVACAAGEAAQPDHGPATPQPQVTFHTASGEIPVRVEVVKKPDDQARGLMFRKKLEPMHGMIFVFPQTAEHSFWMKNTFISLDMIFVSAQQTVVGVVANAEPLTKVPRTVGVPSKFVVEVNAGFAKKYGIGKGTRITMRDVQQQVVH